MADVMDYHGAGSVGSRLDPVSDIGSVGTWRPTNACSRPPAYGIDVHATFTVDLDGCILGWSDGGMTCQGYSPPEMVGHNFAATYTPSDCASDWPRKSLAIAHANGTFRETGWRLRKDGSRLLAYVAIDALRDEQGMVVGFAIVLCDLTALERGHGLFRRANLLQLAVNSMPQGMVVFDADEHVCFWNTSWKLLTPSAVPLLRGASYADVIRGALDGEGGGARSEALATRIEKERRRHLERLSRSGETPFSDVRRVGGRTQVHSHRAISSGGWITTIEDVTDLAAETTRSVASAQQRGAPDRELLPTSVGTGATGLSDIVLFGIEVCRFEAIISTHGPNIGGSVLDVVLSRIQDSLREHHVVNRLGNGRFVVVGGCAKAAAAATADDLAAKLGRPIVAGGETIAVAAVVQAALFPAGPSDLGSPRVQARTMPSGSDQSGGIG